MTPHDPAALARALFDESGDALFLLDPDTDRLLDVNPVALRLTGFDRAELLGFPATELLRAESGGGPQRVRGALAKTVVFHAQDGYLLRSKDAPAGWVAVTVTVSRLHLKPATLGLMIVRDDRDRRAALAQARRVEAELRTVLRNSPAALWSAERRPADPAAGWQFRFVSDLLARLADRPPDFLDSPLRWVEVVHPADRDAYAAAVRALLAGPDEAAEQTYRVARPGGEVRWVRDRLQVIRDSAGNPTRLDGCVADITAERDGEEAVRRSERRFRALVEKSRDGLLLLDAAAVIRYASPAAKPTLGHDPDALVGTSGFALVHPDDLAEARERLADTLARPGEDVAVRLRVRRPDGTARRLEANVCNRLADPTVGALVAHYRDVTERDEWEAALREAQKMEAVGRLAGGVAHDFNNLLTVVLGNLELLRTGADPGEAAELLAGADRAARQAADLTRQLLGFARRHPLRPAAVDLNALARDTLALLRRTVDPRVQFRFLPAPDLPAAAADPVQVQQVLLNLFLNARDAMPEGGILTVETAPADAPAGAAAHPAGYARVSVADTGVGMPEEVRARVFEPFFTTKDVGKGTGLGLAVVYGVAQAHGGAVACASAPGAGSRFDVYLPCAAPDPPAAEAEADAPADDGRGELILIAEDEPAVRELAVMGLELHGFRVAAAADGAEAVELAKKLGAEVKLAVLDATMPRLTGRQAFDAIRADRPDLPVIFASGYSAAKLLPDPPPPRTRFLPKPYTPIQLAAEVRALLDAGG